MDLISPRPDIVFLRRRLRIGEVVPVTEVAQNFLRVSGPDDIMPVGIAIPAKPEARGRTVLTTRSPVVRLNTRQSAIGSLRVAGATEFAWETRSRAAGVGGRTTSGQPVPTFANRKVIEMVGPEVIVGLRHIDVLRRLVFGAADGQITLTTFGGAQIIADTRGGLDAVYVSIIGTVIEVRLETLAPGDTLSRTFSIGL